MLLNHKLDHNNYNAHLNEHYNYYDPVYGLRAFERFLENKEKEAN